MKKAIFSLALLLVFSVSLEAQRATSVRVEKASPEDLLGSVIAVISGKDTLVARNAARAWLIEGGKALVYSGADGAGGFENEGQSLYRCDISTGKCRKLMSEIFQIKKVAEVRTGSGKTALLVTMQDGGLGAYHVAVVNPQRGQVWRYRMARFVGVRNGRIAVGIYPSSAFEREKLPPPQRIAYYNLDELLRRPAVTNKPVGT